jgi:CHASE3 domain sensor protein
MRLLCGIAALTILCMFSVAVITDHLADICLTTSTFSQSSRVHLIDQVTTALKRARDSRKAYLSTGDVSFLNQYNSACSDVDSSMDHLVNEDYEVSSKLAHAQGLREFVHAKLSEIGRFLAHKPAVAKAPAPMPAVDGDLARIQRLLGALGQEETSDISGQLQAAQARTVFHRNLVVTVAVVNLLFLGGVAFCAIQIGKLHSLVTMCAWSKKVEYQGKWIPLEEYVRLRFGVRISHGISQEEYDKWAEPGMAEVSAAEQEETLQNPRSLSDRAPKAAA